MIIYSTFYVTKFILTWGFGLFWVWFCKTHYFRYPYATTWTFCFL